MKKTEKITLAVVYLFALSLIILLEGCAIFDGGMNTIAPPSFEEDYPESVLNDLSPISARDMARTESQKADHHSP